MAFINQLKEMNNEGTLIMTENSYYSYEKFMDDMLLIENSINDILNNYYRVINECAIENILNEESTDLSIVKKEEKESVTAKLKEMWQKIVDAFFNMIDNLYNWIYEQVVLQKNFINKHKDDIMHTTMIYGKTKGDVLNSDGRKVASFKVTVSEPDISTYKKILNPEFMEPITSKSNLDQFINDGRVDAKKIYDFYKDKVLGDIGNVDVEDINAKKANLISNIDKVYNEVKHRKSIIINMQKKSPSEDLTPEEIKDFRLETLAKVQSLRAYNKVLLDYCKASVSILKKFIKSSNENSEKKEDKTNE